MKVTAIAQIGFIAVGISFSVVSQADAPPYQLDCKGSGCYEEAILEEVTCENNPNGCSPALSNTCDAFTCKEQMIEETNLQRTTRRFESQAYTSRIVVKKFPEIVVKKPGYELIDTFTSILKVSGKQPMERVVNSLAGEVGVLVKAYSAIRVDFGGDVLHTVTNLSFTTVSSDGVYYSVDGCNGIMGPTDEINQGRLGVEFNFDQTVCFDRDVTVTYIRGQFVRNNILHSYSSAIQ